jgi:hypothetical protein
MWLTLAERLAARSWACCRLEWSWLRLGLALEDTGSAKAAVDSPTSATVTVITRAWAMRFRFLILWARLRG